MLKDTFLQVKSFNEKLNHPEAQINSKDLIFKTTYNGFSTTGDSIISHATLASEEFIELYEEMKKPDNTERILDEYMDLLYSVIGLGVQLGITDYVDEMMLYLHTRNLKRIENLTYCENGKIANKLPKPNYIKIINRTQTL